MSLGPYEIALISGGFLIIGTILGAWITYRFSLEAQRITEFNKAAAQFRNAFLPEIVYLKRNAVLPGYEIGSSNLRDILNSAYVHRHLAALETFLPHLSLADRSGIDKAWKEYCQDSQGNLNFEQYSCLLGGMGGEKSDGLRQLTIKRIEAILKFTDTK